MAHQKRLYGAATRLGRRVAGVAAVVAVAMALPAEARQLRCPDGLVQRDDHRIFVERRCGEPMAVETRQILRRAIVNPGARSRASDTVMQGEAWVAGHEEVWIYNFGPRRFMREIRFVDGRVRDIESLGYGFNAD